MELDRIYALCPECEVPVRMFGADADAVVDWMWMAIVRAVIIVFECECGAVFTPDLLTPRVPEQGL